MADANTVTGSRDDLVVDNSRCLKMRFSESSCCRCIDICPHGTVTLDGGLAINKELCRGCLLCTAVCPVGALEQSSDISSCLAQLSRVPEPVLGCIRTKEHSNATLACLGGLSEEHLVKLSHTLSGKLTLNMTACSDCPNRAITPHLLKRFEVLLEAGVLEGGCKIVTAESAKDTNYCDESVGRRSFFKFFSNSLFQSAVVILSTSKEPAERRIEYAAKRVPIKRNLLNMSRNKLSQELELRVSEHFDSRVFISEACTVCQGCVAICPTGALQTEQSDTPPTFDQLICTGCGLCSEFCLDGAVQIPSSENYPRLPSGKTIPP